MLSIGTVRYGAPRFMLHVCNEGWTGLANCLRDGVGMERKRTEAWRIVDRTDGGRGRETGGRGSGLLVLVVKMVLLCCEMYSHIYEYNLMYTTPSLPYLSANKRPAILLDPACTQRAMEHACSYPTEKGSTRRPIQG